MKTNIFSLVFLTFIFTSQINAQDITTVNAKNSDISDNLDLRAVASIFGESANLADFERRLNDPKEQISNLDLNNDNNVDYLRVIESVERNAHLIIIQSVLAQDVFQDVATVEVEKDNNNNVQVQVVGDVYMYGQNYIYEPIYVSRPIIYNSFWVGAYNPYYSPFYWNYYPNYYSFWNPYPIFRYQRNVNFFINANNHYNYVNVRRNQAAYAIYSNRRSNGYERLNPNRSFTQRNNNVTNRYELDKTRRVTTTRGPRSQNGVRNNSVSTENMGVNDQNSNTVRNSRTRTATTNGRNNSRQAETAHGETPTRIETVQNNRSRSERASSTSRSIQQAPRATDRNQREVQIQTPVKEMKSVNRNQGATTANNVGSREGNRRG